MDTATLSPPQSIETFMETAKKNVEVFLATILPPHSPESPHALFRSMHYSTLNPAKRLRPTLVYATGHALQAPLATLHAAAASVELVHCYSLIHDDLPAMDDDDTRRGLPACHKAFDEATAILAGDALQSLAFEILSQSTLNPLNATTRIQMVSILAKAIGASGMVLGQAQDMAAQQTPIANLMELQTIHQNKTGALIQACLELGALASGYPTENVLEPLQQFGAKIGLAFQIQDDILDVTAAEHVLGKPPQSDIHNNKSTYPELMGLETAKSYLKDIYQEAIICLESLSCNTTYLEQIAHFIINRIN